MKNELIKNTYYLLSSGPEAWKALLPEPEKQWKSGYSAHSFASAWEGTKGFPPTFQAALHASGLNLELVFGFPEFQVELNDKAPGQNDLFLLARDEQSSIPLQLKEKLTNLLVMKLAFGTKTKAMVKKSDLISF